jgi:Preprotein translocase subunit SecY|nr:MAG: preprotein translocase subunit SecY [Candidatus Nanosalinarum sp. J07AB56]
MADWTARIAGYLPSVAEPEREQSLKEMLTWTGVILVLYFTLSSINITPAPFGSGQVSVVNQALQQLETFQTLLGASIGSIITLGIGPIVTASIVLQMMVGSDLLDWDTNTQSGKQKFQNSKKILAYAISIVQALGYVLSGTFGSITDPVLIFWVTAQIALGGVIIILMDEVVQKWGFGSGVGLFIAAGVSQAIYIRSASFLNGAGEFVGVSSDAVGALPSFAATLDLTALIPVFSTIAVFAAVVYMQSMRVEIPLTFGNVRGFGQKWPLKFLYTSNMPVILIAALVSNVQIVGSTLSGANGSSILGTFSGGQAQSGLVYSAPSSQPGLHFFPSIGHLGRQSVRHLPRTVLHLGLRVRFCSVFSVLGSDLGAGFEVCRGADQTDGNEGSRFPEGHARYPEGSRPLHTWFDGSLRFLGRSAGGARQHHERGWWWNRHLAYCDDSVPSV